MDTVTVKSAPTIDMRYPKKGNTRATTIVLITSVVLMQRLNFLVLNDGNRSSIVFTIGTTRSAYLTIGLMSVVNIAACELALLVGRFKVICDSAFEPNIR
ncbi:hypothetical protein HanRHA438_Chr01g0029781 [Helianthus annuus]|nr:hypothetical protein HanRHA438_Chr01g0029781 [Helianthus annuus]